MKANSPHDSIHLRDTPALRDLDLTRTPRDASSSFPSPPTGHDLMAMFPPPAPTLGLTENTSGYFAKQERQFFAHPGKEIIRVGFELEVNAHGGVLGPTIENSQRFHLPHSADMDMFPAPPLPLQNTRRTIPMRPSRRAARN
ncbi:hypothetical protein CYLTODRAFT_424454 [Cylindrobasidium torrendii FP15055 ss-10]|uniref:Uncharacterized protein n=1 Tax=Cylindrobasidium torrendii FP15055 ss-10 TaxID=1314674 RepID=A0A0D7B564_9AGAR|nr:hypothetical protein CYLTODRAFT_424454 [Cylindrobasidium torrendii FP15055 ss-10]